MNENNNRLRREIDKWFEIHLNEMLEDLGRLIEIISVSGPKENGAPYGAGPRAAIALARLMLEERGFVVDEFEDMVVTVDLGPSPPLMGILTHLDVVDAGDGWDSDPYKMTLRDGKIYGRGANDDKGPSIAAMYAVYCVRDVCPELKHGVRLIMGSGEEVGCEDIERYLSVIGLPAHVFTPDADYPVVNVEKGRLAAIFGADWDRDVTTPRIVSIIGGKTMNVVPDSAKAVIEGFTQGEAEEFCREYSAKTGTVISAVPDGGRLVITANGTASHAALPHKGNNAQTALIKMLAAMPFAQSGGFERLQSLNRLFPHGDYHGCALGIAMDDKISGALTVNFGVLEFTETGFTGNFDSRTSACADEVDLCDMTRTALEREDIAPTSLVHTNSHHTPENSPFVQTLLRVYSEYTGKPGKCLKIGGQSYVHGVPGGVAFGCAMPGIEYNIHAANESIGVEELIISAKMFARVIIEMCSKV